MELWVPSFLEPVPWEACGTRNTLIKRVIHCISGYTTATRFALIVESQHSVLTETALQRSKPTPVFGWQESYGVA